MVPEKVIETLSGNSQGVIFMARSSCHKAGSAIIASQSTADGLSGLQTTRIARPETPERLCMRQLTSMSRRVVLAGHWHAAVLHTRWVPTLCSHHCHQLSLFPPSFSRSDPKDHLAFILYLLRFEVGLGFRCFISFPFQVTLNQELTSPTHMNVPDLVKFL